MSFLSIVEAESVAPQAWRNGGGQTRELLAWPAGGDWKLRISRADITTDGPFSAFPNVERWFTVLQGAGVALRFADGERALKPGDAPLCFDGAAAPGCRLLDGPTQDLNLMVRGGLGAMHPVQAGQGWDEPFAMRGLYTTVAGRWSGEPPSRAIAAQSSRAIASQTSGAVAAPTSRADSAPTSRADTAQTSRAVAAHTLLWDAHAGAGVWAFEPQIQVQTQGTGAQAWWLGFTPGS